MDGYAGRLAALGSGIPALGEIGLNHFAPFLMNSIVRHWNAALADELRQSGASTATARTLAVLSITSGRTVNELAELTLTEQSTMSRLLDGLEAQGLVARQTRPADARVREVHITPRGREAFDGIWRTMHRGYARMVDGIPAAELSACIATLNRMLANTREEGAVPA